MVSRLSGGSGAVSGNGALLWPPSSHSVAGAPDASLRTVSAYDAYVQPYFQVNWRVASGITPVNRTAATAAGPLSVPGSTESAIAGRTSTVSKITDTRRRNVSPAPASADRKPSGPDSVRDGE